MSQENHFNHSNMQCNQGNYKLSPCKRRKIKEILGIDIDHKPPVQDITLDKITSPNREQRAHGTNIYYGKASKLLDDAINENVHIKERKFQQSGGCVLNFYLAVRVSTIRDAVVIFNAPVGCSSSALG